MLTVFQVKKNLDSFYTAALTRVLIFFFFHYFETMTQYFLMFLFFYLLRISKIGDMFDFSDINRRGLERCDVRRDSSLRRRRQYRRARVRLLHHSFHMRQLYPLFKKI